MVMNSILKSAIKSDLVFVELFASIEVTEKNAVPDTVNIAVLRKQYCRYLKSTWLHMTYVG